MTTAPERERTVAEAETHLDDLVAAVADVRRLAPALVEDALAAIGRPLAVAA